MAEWQLRTRIIMAMQEAQSPFCWLCERPQRLVLPQKMPGQRRIWRLPSKQMVAGMQRALKVPLDTALCHDPHLYWADLLASLSSTSTSCVHSFAVRSPAVKSHAHRLLQRQLMPPALLCWEAGLHWSRSSRVCCLQDPAALPPFAWPRPLPGTPSAHGAIDAPGARVTARLYGSAVR